MAERESLFEATRLAPHQTVRSLTNSQYTELEVKTLFVQLGIDVSDVEPYEGFNALVDFVMGDMSEHQEDMYISRGIRAYFQSTSRPVEF